MMEKNSCEVCNHNLQVTPADTCLYCGATIPEHLRLSMQEKEAIRIKQEHYDAMDKIMNEGYQAFKKKKLPHSNTG